MKNYRKVILSLSFVLFLSGCATSKLEFKQEPLTGKEYCLASITLLPLKNSKSGIFTMKYDREDFAEKKHIKATLHIVQEGREYHINPRETLTLFTDGTPYALQVINSFQEPQEVATHFPMLMPSGKTVMLGSMKEVTKRDLSFFLPIGYLSKMIAAKKVTFEIGSLHIDDKAALQKSSIILELRTDDVSFLQEFKNKCINNSLTQSGVKK